MSGAPVPGAVQELTSVTPAAAATSAPASSAMVLVDMDAPAPTAVTPVDSKAPASPTSPEATIRPLLSASASADSQAGDKAPDARYVVGADGKAVKEKYRVAEEKDFLRAYGVFALDKAKEGGGINASQCYAIQNMLNQPSKEPSWQDLEEAFDEVDSNHNGLLDVDEYKRLLRRLNEVVEAHPRPKARSGVVVFLVLFLWFFPFLAWFARPGAPPGSIGDLAHYGLQQFLRATGLAHRFRVRVMTSWVWFIVFWMTYTFFECGLLVNFGLDMNQVKFVTYFDDGSGGGNSTSTRPPLAQAGYVARAESCIPAALALLATVMLPFMFVTDDSDLVEAREKVKEHGPLSSFKVKLSRWSPVQTVTTAEDVLAHMFYRPPSETKAMISSTKWRWLVSTIASLVVSVAPFIVRIYYGYPFFGKCFPSDGCTDRTNSILLVMSVFSFFGSFFMVCWFVFFLTSTTAIYSERLQLIRRLYALLDEEKAKELDTPYLVFESAANIIVWSKLRTYTIAFKNLELRKCEILITTLLIGFLLIFVFIIYQSVHPFQTPINSVVLYVTTGYSVLMLGAYLLYPTVYTALAINDIQAKITKWLSEEQWRLIVRTETVHNAEKRPLLERCHKLVKAVAAHMKDIDSTFTILGVAITPSLFGSMIAAIIASIASWLSSVLI